MSDKNQSKGNLREERSFSLSELRVDAQTGQPPKIVGYAAVFDAVSDDLGGFKEKIKPGAFKKTLKEADVRALFNHDQNYVLGRTKSGTLNLSEDARGLRIEITPPDTQWARDLMESMRRGDVDQMSFAFRSVRDNWGHDSELYPLRTLEEVQLYDVSPVTFPAYPQTTAQVRELVAKLTQESPVQESHGQRDFRRELEILELEVKI